MGKRLMVKEESVLLTLQSRRTSVLNLTDHPTFTRSGTQADGQFKSHKIPPEIEARIIRLIIIVQVMS